MKVAVTTSGVPTADAEKFGFLSECGFNGADIDLGHYFGKDGIFGDIKNVTDDQIKDYFCSLKQKADAAGVEVLQTTSEFKGRVALYLDEEQTDSDFDIEDVILRQIASIKATHYLGAKYTVILPIVHTDRRYDIMVDESFNATKEFYLRLLPTLKEYGVICLLQNTYNEDRAYQYPCATIFSRAHEMLKMCDELGEQFKVCLDLGISHVTQDVPEKDIVTLKDKLVSIHVNDNPGWCYIKAIPFLKFGQPPSTRSRAIDWGNVFGAIKTIGYDGILSFNVTIPGEGDVIKDSFIYLNEVTKYFYDRIESEREQ